MLANLLPVGKLRGIDIGGASDVGNREKRKAAGNRKAREKRYKFITPTSADGDGPGLAFPQTLRTCFSLAVVFVVVKTLNRCQHRATDSDCDGTVPSVS